MGNIIRWDELDADGVLYGVTTDGQFTVAATPGEGGDGWTLDFMDRDGRGLGVRKIYVADLDGVKLSASELINQAARGLL